MKSLIYLSLFGILSSSGLQALPVDLSTPAADLGPITKTGIFTYWQELGEIDFGRGLLLPLRFGFYASRNADNDFGNMPWRPPVFSSRIYNKTDQQWEVLLPCGRVLTLEAISEGPNQAPIFQTPDGEWQASTDPDGSIHIRRADGWDMHFNGKGRLQSLRTDEGRLLQWQRNEQGQLQAIAEVGAQGPMAPALRVERNAGNGLVSALKAQTRRGQQSWSLGYDAQPALNRIGNPDGTQTLMTYRNQAQGQPQLELIEPNLTRHSFTWDQQTKQLLSDGVWTYRIQARPDDNPIIERRGPNGEVESLQKDRASMREIFIAADGSTTVRQLVKRGRAKGKLKTVIRQSPGEEPITLYQATYDQRGLLTEETDAMGQRTQHSYILHGSNIHLGIREHRSSRSASLSLGAAPQTLTEVRRYDRHGNLISMTDAAGHQTQYQYDDQNRLSQTLAPDGSALETLTYTPKGQIATRRDALGATTTHRYDDQGNRIATTDALGAVTTHRYNAQGLLTETIDALGGITRFDYDKGRRLIQQTVAHGTPIAATTLYTYDDQGRRLTSTDPAGHTTTQTYDKLGRLTSRTDALGQSTRYEYDVKRGSTGCISCSASGLPTRIISPSGRVTERRYNAERNLIEETLAAGSAQAATTRHLYDRNGNLLQTTDPLGRTTVHEYNAINLRLKTLHADGSSRSYAYNAGGQLIAETNELGHTTRRDYDAFGNLIALTNPEGHTTRTLYQGPKEQPSAMAALHRPSATLSPSGETTALTYDLLGRRIAVTKAAGSNLSATTTHTFDAVGNEIESTSPTGQITRHEYDARHRRIRTHDAMNRTWSFAYDSDSGPSGPAPCCGAELGANTRAAQITYPDGSKETRTTNAAGQLIATTDAKGDTVKYGYDPDGRMSSLTDAKGSVTTWRYDARGKLITKTYPDKTTELYEHDLAGQVTRRIRPDGSAATYSYNERGRLLKIDWNDDKTEDSTFAYDAAGHMTLAQNRSASLRRSYHPSGRLQKEVQQLHPQFGATAPLPDPAPTFEAEVNYQYSPEGRLARLTYPDTSTIGYEYNARGELARIEQRSPTQPNPAAYHYERNAEGRLLSLALPNGAKTTKTYDEAGRLQTIAHLDKDGKVLESETSRYDLRNRRTARTKADGSTDLFAYDPAGQVTAAAYAQSQPKDNATPKASDALGFEPTQTFRYDPAGNRLESTDKGMTTTYQPNAANQYEQIVIGSEIVEPEFDRNGNLLQDDRNTYTWDSDIHLLSITTKPKAKPETKNPEQSTAFRYDALHRRIARLEPQGKLTLFVMDGWNVIEEHQATFTAQPHGKAAHGATQGSLTRPGKDAKPTLSVRHSWGEDLSGTLQGAGGIGGLLASVHQSPNSPAVPLWFHGDSNGNVILLTDERAQPAARYSYDAFGQTITATGIAANLNRYRFSTKPVESSSGLAYYGYRYYDPALGRWSSRDPIEERGGLNVYAMVGNGANNDTDTLGQNRTLGGIAHLNITVENWECRNGKWVKDGTRTRYDFYPANLFSGLLSILAGVTAPGEISASGTAGTVADGTTSNACQDNDLHSWIAHLQKIGLSYHFYGYNCRDFANEMMNRGMSIRCQECCK